MKQTWLRMDINLNSEKGKTLQVQCNRLAVKINLVALAFLSDFDGNFVCTAFLQLWCNFMYRKSTYKNGFHCYKCSLYG